LHVTKNKFHTENRGVLKSARPAAIATFATIVNPALSVPLLIDHKETWSA